MDERTDHEPQTTPEPTPTPPPHDNAAPQTSASIMMSEKDERQWAMLTHISALSGLLTGFGFLVGPLIMWLIRKDQSAFVDEQGKEAVNFQITMMIAAFVSSLLIVLVIGLPMLFVVVLAMTILPIIAGLKASEGESYRYPFTLRLIK